MVFSRILQALRSPQSWLHGAPNPKDSETKWFRMSVEYGQADGFDFACSQGVAIAIGTALTTAIIWLTTVSLPYSTCLLMTKMGTVNAPNNLCAQVVAPAAPVSVKGVSPLQ